MTIKCHLSRILGEKRINISELSKMAGIARNTATALYHEDAKGVTWDVLEKLCAALNCQPGDLLEYIPARDTND
ncbi:helix-turn-helix domain-containing protein [Sporomusa aerivorans]|uniref:helix-turn-helix domain-containing protein n=1 Tax=Sporomusa aerivorans TaxID=204936 RepID=UPI00352A40BE